jgi:prophage tail gpP-like protein
VHSQIEVLVGSSRFTGWESVTVTTSLGSAAASVQLTGSALPARGLSGQEPIEVRHGATPVFRGHLDDMRLSVLKDSTGFDSSGRSLAADLVDSQVDPLSGPREVLNQSPAAIAQRYILALAPRIGLDLSLLDSSHRIEKFAHATGETYWAAMERALRTEGILATAGPRGELRLISPSRFERLPLLLREGENVLGMTATTSFKERANLTVARGQGSSTGDDWESTLEVTGTAEDLAVRATRISVVQVEGEPSEAECLARAQWEQAIRAARGSHVNVVVPEWTFDVAGSIYRPGMIAPVALPSIGISGSLVIDSVQLRETGEGRTTQLSLVRRDAYAAKPQLAIDEDSIATSFAEVDA